MDLHRNVLTPGRLAALLILVELSVTSVTSTINVSPEFIGYGFGDRSMIVKELNETNRIADSRFKYSGPRTFSTHGCTEIRLFSPTY